MATTPAAASQAAPHAVILEAPAREDHGEGFGMVAASAAAVEPSLVRRPLVYLELTKPKVVALMVFTAIVGSLLASPGLPPVEALLWGNLGIALASGCAAAINHVLDRRIDEQMIRTRARPLPRGRISERQALLFAAVLGVLSMSILAFLVNRLTAVLTFASLIGYAVVYTVWLKRATSQNIVIGGAAGAAPPVLGWAAVTGTVGPPAWVREDARVVTFQLAGARGTLANATMSPEITSKSVPTPAMIAGLRNDLVLSFGIECRVVESPIVSVCVTSEAGGAGAMGTRAGALWLASADPRGVFDAVGPLAELRTDGKRVSTPICSLSSTILFTFWRRAVIIGSSKLETKLATSRRSAK